jgi:hypothetical protein
MTKILPTTNYSIITVILTIIYMYILYQAKEKFSSSNNYGKQNILGA